MVEAKETLWEEEVLVVVEVRQTERALEVQLYWDLHAVLVVGNHLVDL